MASIESSAETRQRPLPSPFNAASTADDIVQGLDLSGKNIIVTGGYSGIGLEMVRVLAGAGAHVFVPARDVTRATAAIKGLKGTIEVGSLDLADPSSIDAFVQGFLAKNKVLHVLLNNAGLGCENRELDGRGYEKTFAVNHLGPFQLTVGLLPALRAAQGSRVVFTASAAHRMSPIRWDDMHFNNTPYHFWLSYGQSKTANVLTAYELDKREKGNGVRAYATHPGVIVTHISSNPLFFQSIGAMDAQGNHVIDPDRGYKTPSQGASTEVFAAVSPVLKGTGGVYLENNDISPISHPDPNNPDHLAPGVRLYAIDDAESFRLWEMSEQMLSK